MEPWFEAVSVPADRSWLLFDRRLPEFPFNWHYHPEFELTLTLNSAGMRFVGDSVESYGDGDLVLLGPNLPHAWQSQALIETPGVHRAVVCWFTRDWIEGLIALTPELTAIKPLLEESGHGICFGEAELVKVRERLATLHEIAPEQQILTLLGVLVDLSRASDRRPLSSGETSASTVPRDRARMQRVLSHIHAHYTGTISIKPLSEIAHLSDSQLQRLFKRSTRMTISQYVGQLRIGGACRLLAQTDRSLARIAEETGFSDPAHFSRQFRAARGMTPGDYRRQFASRSRVSDG
ncbi:AraC family transcriptional regulator [Rhizobium sp. BR 250]